ncbi:hypothetical protein N7455_000013 [Penicillium solitum]|uniref:uncharacterized protein n=1 Tax=Penicillium solitum TaxID=60172 RepID=UPI0032C426FB|nr:hypothetical protein N7455_000013 [Penicillium solitum]
MPLNTEPLEVGARGNIKLTDDMCMRRVISHSNSDRGSSFREEVRARDRKCVLTGVINPAAGWGDWSGYEAAHIFPMEKETLWNQHNLSRWITNTTGRHNATINSSKWHDGYKTTHFGGDGWGVDGRVLDPVCRDPNDPNRVADNLLRWHFCQSVLANMRGPVSPSSNTTSPQVRM